LVGVDAAAELLGGGIGATAFTGALTGACAEVGGTVLGAAAEAVGFVEVLTGLALGSMLGNYSSLKFGSCVVEKGWYGRGGLYSGSFE
jgi:uncharacterized membrane protein YoaK (UPF0700 family)